MIFIRTIEGILRLEGSTGMNLIFTVGYTVQSLRLDSDQVNSVEDHISTRGKDWDTNPMTLFAINGDHTVTVTGFITFNYVKGVHSY